MKLFASRMKLIVCLLILISLIEIFAVHILIHITARGLLVWEYMLHIAASIAEILLVLWIFFLAKKIIQQALENERHVQHLLDSSPEAIVIHKNGTLVYTNKAAGNLFGAEDSTQFLNKSIYDLIQFENESLKNEEYQAKRLDGTTFIVETSISHIDFKGERAVEMVIKDITIRKNQEIEMKQLVYEDSLTKLPNRRAFMDKLEQTIKHAKQTNKKFAVMFLDLDGFKQVNDSFGHESGDYLLQQVSRYLEMCVRKQDTVSRFAGDEFLILLPEVDKDDCADIAKRIIQQLSHSHSMDGKKAQVTSSIGIAMYPENGESSKQLIEQADQGMYKAKQGGKNRFTFVSGGMGDEEVS
ncbi:sensor domain-containing diguanylate cyclase [Halalkalibacter okhensis]|uniref:sensor domain-containing diguanylate cyclase n=1 Tax=Halalkalibacter okhensis TaxID=333138 RepID=UPI0006903286|nr:sensor domain-containing diguanylate cyclase [Halalkalibacter okhensis]